MTLTLMTGRRIMRSFNDFFGQQNRLFCAGSGAPLVYFLQIDPSLVDAPFESSNRLLLVEIVRLSTARITFELEEHFTFLDKHRTNHRSKLRTASLWHPDQLPSCVLDSWWSFPTQPGTVSRFRFALNMREMLWFLFAL
mmetsp:Transcript_180/g.626  ORF Transcript_180/g.626 Transcript_180/m.626 type:complete len:139 (-) Transcript_180:87-503(-)